jgi:fructose-bisphosphate aldolase class I
MTSPSHLQQLEQNAKYLVQPGRGLLAADESTASANRRFAPLGIAETPENRRQYRELLFTTPSAENALSGVIFYDETFWQNGVNGQPLRTAIAEKGILVGIKLDQGLQNLPGFSGEKISQGLDSLEERIDPYREGGATFAKWRSVIAIGEEIPSQACIEANVYVLARYARICQDAGLVPIVEPEVLFDGNHTASQCESTMIQVFEQLFKTMTLYRVHLPGAILKTSMVLPGKDSGIPLQSESVAASTTRVLHGQVPSNLGGVVFLSGGQTSEEAFQNLNAIALQGPHPWGVTFSYSRALQDPVLKYWATHPDDITGSQAIFAQQLALAVAAREGSLPAEISIDNFVSGSQDL